LDAEVSLIVNQEWFNKLQAKQDELKFLFIVSKVTLELDNSIQNDDSLPEELQGLSITVSPSKAQKCVRCWHRSDDIGLFKGHEEICGRCVTNVTTASGEIRLFA